MKVGHKLEQKIISDSQVIELLVEDGSTPCIYLVTSPFESMRDAIDLLPSWVNEFRVPIATFVYDLIPKLFPEIYLPDQVARRWYQTRLALIQSSDLLLTISDATRRDELSELGVKSSSVVNIGAGVNTDFFTPGDLEHCDGRKQQVVCVAGYEPRKNVPRLLEA